MNVAEESHPFACWIVSPETESFAKLSAALMSSFSSSGWSDMISSVDIPALSISRMTSTGHRIPLITGLPWQTAGSIVILLAKVFINVKIRRFYQLVDSILTPPFKKTTASSLYEY
jgi:hypothetical protein